MFVMTMFMILLVCVSYIVRSICNHVQLNEYVYDYVNLVNKLVNKLGMGAEDDEWL